MGTKILRPKAIYGHGNPLPVGATKFWEDFVYQPGGEEFIPGTTIPRLRLVRLGGRAVGGFQDEVQRIVEALRVWRDSARRDTLRSLTSRLSRVDAPPPLGARRGRDEP
jgi:hypothetical protein